MSHQRLDTSGLRCPLPVLRVRRAMKEVAVGACLEVVATDPAAAKDFPAFCEATGHLLEESGEMAPGVFRFLIRKTA